MSTANESSLNKMKEDTRANYQPVEKSMRSMTEGSSIIYPTLLATVREETIRIMVDTRVTSSYVCTDLTTKLGTKPVRREQRCIEKMHGTMKKTVEVYNITIKSSAIEVFQLKVDCINAEKDILTHVQNPKITRIKNRNPRIRGLRFQEEGETQDLLPTYVTFGVADYQRIRTNEPPVLRLNTNTDPVAEYTKLGWTLCGGVARKTQFEKQCL